MGLHPVGVGSDVEAQCGRCKEVTWHVVLAMVDGGIAKVQCKACDAQHRYRPPPGARAAKPRKRAPAASGGSGGRSRGKRAAAAPPPGPTVEPDMTRPVRDYRPDEAYAVADRVRHSRFGVGVVEHVAAGKVTVFFDPAGRKILAQARSEARLSHPPRLRFDD